VEGKARSGLPRTAQFFRLHNPASAVVPHPQVPGDGRLCGGPRDVIVEFNTTPPLAEHREPTLWQQQDVDIYLQSVCKTFNVVDRDISYLAFNVRHEGAMQARFQREIFLRPSPFLAEANYVHRKELTRRWRAWTRR
jgi:hypothetical protein